MSLTVLTLNADGSAPEINPGNVTLSGNVATFTGSSQVYGNNPVATGTYYFETTVEALGNFAIGICSPAHVSTSNDMWDSDSQGGTTYDSGYPIYSNGSSTGISIGSAVVGTVIGCLVTLPGTVQFNFNGGAFCTPIAIPYSPTPICPVIASANSGPQLSVNFGATSFAYPLPAGAGPWPAAGGITLTINSVTGPLGSPLDIGWSATNGTVSGLNYSLNAGAWTPCTGSTSGSSGTALGPTLSSEQFFSLNLQDAANSSVQSGSQRTNNFQKPSGAGSILATGSGSSNGSISVTGSLSSDQPAVVFKFFESVTDDSGGGVTGGPSFTILSTDSVVPYLTAGNFAVSNTGTNQGNVYGGTPVTGPSAVNISTSSLVVGTLSATSNGTTSTLAATISNNGTTSTYTSEVTSPNYEYLSYVLTNGVLYPDYSNTYQYYFAVYTNAPETLTITGASYNNLTEVLTVQGACLNSTLGTASVSTNGGTLFNPATSLSVTGTAYTATLAGSLTAGTTYPLQTEDDANGTLSNVYPFTVPAPNNLYASQVVEQVLCSIPDDLFVSQALQQVLLSLPQFNRVGLFQTDAVPNSESSYIEFGSQLSWNYETSLLPDNQEVSNNGMVVTTLDLAFVGSSPVVAVSSTDAAGNLITNAAVVSGGTDSIWDEAVWDVTVWDGTASPLSPWQIPWPQAVVFRQMQIAAAGYSVAGFRIGNLYMQYQQLGYVAQLSSGAR